MPRVMMQWASYGTAAVGHQLKMVKLHGFGSTSKTPTIQHTRVAPFAFRRNEQSFMFVDPRVLLWHVFPQDSQSCWPGGHGTGLGGRQEGVSPGHYARRRWRKVRSTSSSINHLLDSFSSLLEKVRGEWVSHGASIEQGRLMTMPRKYWIGIVDHQTAVTSMFLPKAIHGVSRTMTK